MYELDLVSGPARLDGLLHFSFPQKKILVSDYIVAVIKDDP